MTNITETPPVADQEESPFSRRVFQVLFELAKQYRKQFLVVSLFSFLYTGLDLLQPLVYRRAINDVAGLFMVPGTVTPSGVPAQSPEQTFRTLVISAVLLFVIAVC